MSNVTTVIKPIATRESYGNALVECGRENENIVNEANKKWNIKTVDEAPAVREANTIYFIKIR